MTAIITGLILYGSFCPFEFSVPAEGVGALQTFINSVGSRPGRGDLIVNVVLYLPFGFFFVLGFTRRWAAVPLGVLCGAALSLLVELTQYYDATCVNRILRFLHQHVGRVAWLHGRGRRRVPLPDAICW